MSGVCRQCGIKLAMKRGAKRFHVLCDVCHFESFRQHMINVPKSVLFGSIDRRNRTRTKRRRCN